MLTQLRAGHLGLRAGQTSPHGLRPLLLPPQRKGWSGSAPDPLRRLLPHGLWSWTLQEVVDRPPALCSAQVCPKRFAGCTCPLDLPRACLTLMGSVAAELSPTPASLTDLIQNSYSCPVLSPGTVNLGEKCTAFRKGQTNSMETFLNFLEQPCGDKWPPAW